MDLGRIGGGAMGSIGLYIVARKLKEFILLVLVHLERAPES